MTDKGLSPLDSADVDEAFVENMIEEAVVVYENATEQNAWADMMDYFRKSISAALKARAGSQ